MQKNVQAELRLEDDIGGPSTFLDSICMRSYVQGHLRGPFRIGLEE